jgi:carboxyl-terminal processing protease
MSMNPRIVSLFRPLGAVTLAVLLAGCGGGGGEESCGVEAQKSYLQSYFDDWYLWYRVAPKPAPASHPDVNAFFDASLYTGGTVGIPADRWSYFQTTEAFNQFFGDGATLGYGIFVAGLEVKNQPDKPLLIRYVEARSPAAAAGLVRGDEIISLNTTPKEDVIRSDDFSLLTPTQAGQALSVTYRRGNDVRTASLSAAVYNLSPVQPTQVLTSATGRKVGYLMVKDMISQVNDPLATAFAQFAAQGVQELALDLRYNGGGLVSTGAWLASYVAGASAANQVYAQLVYNDKQSGNNFTQRFSQPANALGLRRVYVLTGQRTCSASEQLINGLKPFVDVVVVGDTTCGKPVGFLPRSYCGNTYSVVNFDSRNARGEGAYYDGLTAQCTVADNPQQPLGQPGENLLATAMRHVDTGSCGTTAQREQPQARQARARGGLEPGEHQGMLAR